MIGCGPKMPTDSKHLHNYRSYQNYKLYENIILDTYNHWIDTGIHVSSESIVIIYADGKIHYYGSQWWPYQYFKFKIGKEGTESYLYYGSNRKLPANTNAISSGKEGNLYVYIGPFKSESFPMLSGKLNLTIVIWEKEHQEYILTDLENFDLAKRKNRLLHLYLSRCLADLGDYEKADKIINKYMKYKGKYFRDRPSVLLWKSNIQYCLGRYDKAKEFATESLEAFTFLRDKTMQSSAFFYLAQAETGLRNYQKAIEYTENGLKIAKNLGLGKSHMGRLYFWLGYNHLILKKYNDAITNFKKAIGYLKRSDVNKYIQDCYLSLGKAYLTINNREKAKDSFRLALSSAEAALKTEVLWVAHGGLGKIAEEEKNLHTAFEHYSKAVLVIESLRGKITDPVLKGIFFENKIQIYEWIIDVLHKMKRYDEAFFYLERVKARIMLDMLAEKAFSSKNIEENGLLQKERDLRNKIDALSRGINIFLEDQTQKSNITEEKVTELKRLKAEHHSIIKRIEKLNPELVSLLTITPMKAKEIQALLNQDTAILEYFLGPNRSYIFVITRHRVLCEALQISNLKLFNEIQFFRSRAIEGLSLNRLDKRDYEKPLVDLYNELIRPIESEISGKKKLIIVPHGMLHYLPFQALLSTGGDNPYYLIESFAIAYLPSASILKYVKVKNKGNREHLFAVGNPSTNLTPLPGAEKEVLEISTLFEKNLVLTREKATESMVKSQSPHYDMIIFSTHGEMINDDPLQSNLRFASSAEDDGKLTVDEIFDMEITANLVTLSACETALVQGEAGKFPQGDDLVGLSRAFIHAGAPSVLASLWKVSDDSTIQLMRKFYQNLQSMPKAEALRKAQLDLMKSRIRFTVERGVGITQSVDYNPGIDINCSHPFFWAPFILVGDWM
jgi:CHAT domain-containing protein/Tfp pilus assembly protein PilF